MKKSFTTLEEKIDELENEDSKLTSSDSEDSDEDSHFQFVYFLFQGCEGLFHFLIELIYILLVRPSGFY